MSVAYFDTSALAKLILPEAESRALLAWTAGTAPATRVTSALTRVELLRAAGRRGPQVVDAARYLLAAVEQIALSPEILDDAALLPPATLRSLDAVHLATARRLGSAVTAFVVYDHRVRDAATATGLPVVTPT